MTPETPSLPDVEALRVLLAQAIFDATPDRFMRVEQCYPAADAILSLGLAGLGGGGLREALLPSGGLESGPNGRGGMRVVVHFDEPGTEQPLFNLLNETLYPAAPLPSNPVEGAKNDGL